jgi:hypothetical protein
MHQPRLDISGTDLVTLDARLPRDVIDTVSAAHRARVRPDGVYPNLFACPSIVGHDPVSGTNAAGAFVASPRAAAIAETDL